MKISLGSRSTGIIRQQSNSGVYDETNFLDEIKKKKTERAIRNTCDELTDKELEEIIETENINYHEKSKPRITDLQYDVIKEELQRRKPKSKVLKLVGAPVSSRAEKVKLPFVMPSLDKIKPDTKEMDSYVESYPGPYVISDKEDGSALQLDYRKGLKIYTRGRNGIGRDVTRLAKHMNIPQSLKKGIVVRGEITMEQGAFAKKYSKDKLGDKDGYEDRRSMVNSLVNKSDSNPAHMKDTHFLAHGLLYPRMKPSAAYKLLKQMGFTVVYHQVVPKITSAVLSKMFLARRAKHKRGIDGLVVEQDKEHALPRLGDNPAHAVAFKMLLDEDVKEVKVLDVLWEESKHGQLKPRVSIVPTKLGGVTVKFATGYNAKFIVDNNIGIGAVVRITRSGDVIPKILETIKPAKKPALPTNIDYKWNATKVDIVMEGTSDLVEAKRITSFFVTMGIENIKLGVVQQLQEAGLDSIKKILDADVNDFLEVEGFKLAKAKKLRDSIDAKISNVPLWTLMDATGIFGQGLGSKKFKPVIEMIPDILAYAELPKHQIVNRVLEVKGFSDKSAEQFAKGLPKFAKYIKTLGVQWNVPTKKKAASSKLAGKVFMFTGFRDKAAEEYIEANGGRVGTSVTKDTTALVMKDIKSGSSKATKADALGVPKLTFTQFQSKYMK